MTEFNPNCGKCGMLNSRGFCSLTACRYPSNAIVVESKVIRGMMVNPQIENPKTHFDEIKSMSVDEFAEWLSDVAGWLSAYEGKVHPILKWLKSPVEVDNGRNG